MGKYEYLRLPMGLCNSPDIFQEKIDELFQDFSEVRAYIDDLLILTKGSWEDHLKSVRRVLKVMKKANLRINAPKSFFARESCEYLGYWITRNGIQPLPKKVEAIKAIAPLKTTKQVRSFVGLVNYYRDLFPCRAHNLAPLTCLCSKNVKFQWT